MKGHKPRVEGEEGEMNKKRPPAKDGRDGGDDWSSIPQWWGGADEFSDKGQDVLTSRSPQLSSRLRLLRHLERVAGVASDAVDDLRYKLVHYRPGDLYASTGGLIKEDLDIPPVITILLAGIGGSGTSSLVNLMSSVLGGAGLISFAQSSRGSRMWLEEHNVLRSPRNGFCIFDSKGFNCENMGEQLAALEQWIQGGVRHLQQYDKEGSFESSKYAKRPVNCTLVVANVAEISAALKNGDLRLLEATRDLFSCPAVRKYNERPLLVLTHGDQLSANDRLEGRVKICEFLGISETTGAYDISCVTEQGLGAEEHDPVSAFQLCEALYRALLSSDRTHPPKKNFKDSLLLVVTWFMLSIAAFFAFLASCFSKFGENTKKLKS